MDKYTSPSPTQPISSLTVADLEILIAETVRRVLHEEGQLASAGIGHDKPLRDEFLATFGSWEDPRSADDIIAEIYDSRTVSVAEVSL